MRPYRALTKDGKMVYGWYFYEKLNDKHYILVEPFLLADYRFDAIVGHIEIIPESVAQQVGKQDKNKNEIYEGDIMIWNIKQVGIWPGQDKPEEVKYPFVCGNAHLGKIIGNVHQHLELLEKLL